MRSVSWNRVCLVCTVVGDNEHSHVSQKDCQWLKCTFGQTCSETWYWQSYEDSMWLTHLRPLGHIHCMDSSGLAKQAMGWIKVGWNQKDQKRTRQTLFKHYSRWPEHYWTDI